MEINELPQGKKIILFDGVCNLCDAVINKVIKADKKNHFVFASLQSETGQKIIQHIGLDQSTDSVVLYIPGYAYYVKSDAALEIAKLLGGKYSLLSLSKIFPKALRDKGYDYIAKNRYKWYGKKDQCMIPTPEIKAKFIE